jgi:hypothetical protein
MSDKAKSVHAVFSNVIPTSDGWVTEGKTIHMLPFTNNTCVVQSIFKKKEKVLIILVDSERYWYTLEVKSEEIVIVEKSNESKA